MSDRLRERNVRTAAERAAEWVRREVRAMRAYPVADSSGLVKLDAMENPYPWPADMVDAWCERLREAEPNRYPDPRALRLCRRLRERLAIPDDAAVLLGNGSDELIQLLVLCLGGPGRVVLAPEPTFVMYHLLSVATGGRFESVPLRGGDFGLDVDATLSAIERHRPALVFLAYPNNPTGNLFDRAAVDAIIDAAPGVVVVDEAYEPFARQSYLSRLAEAPNLIVMRTLSKLGLAGLRLGLIAGAPAWLDEFDKLRLPYNVNTLTQLSAEFALERYDVLEAQAARIREERERLRARLERIGALRVWPSDANFLLCRLERGDAQALGRELRQRGILIKILDGAAPSLAGCVRISIGTEEQNDAVAGALEDWL